MKKFFFSVLLTVFLSACAGGDRTVVGGASGSCCGSYAQNYVCASCKDGNCDACKRGTCQCAQCHSQMKQDAGEAKPCECSKKHSKKHKKPLKTNSKTAQ